jgi:hypothetical protein
MHEGLFLPGAALLDLAPTKLSHSRDNFILVLRHKNESL